MKAAFIEELGPPSVIKYGDLPEPICGSRQVLVKVDAVAVDPIDTYIRSGSYKIELDFPFIIGRDMIGTVVEVGSEVERRDLGFKPGDRVWCNNQGYAGRPGTFAEYLTIDSTLLYRVPDNADALRVVASCHSALTTVMGLVRKAKLVAGESIFINGGSGNVGLCAIELSRSMDAKIAATAGTMEKEDWCQSAGADIVINYKKTDVENEVKKAFPNGVDVYWDLTREPDLARAVRLCAPRGRILISSGLKHNSVVPIGDLYTKNLTIYGFTITNLKPDELAANARVLNNLYERNIFNPHLSKVLQLKDAALAHQLVEDNAVVGKVVLKVSDSK